MSFWPGVIEAYRPRLSVDEATPVVTLQEGGTPLVEARSLSQQFSRPVFLKFEGTNPSGSFKDRGMTLAISKAKQRGAQAVVCASTGNTAASAAAYAARAGMECVVVLPAGRVAYGKLAQAVVHQAQIVSVEGSFDVALALLREAATDHHAVLVNSVNPDRIEGQQTLVWEVVDQLGEAPAVHCLPVGNAGNITAHWQGYREAKAPPQLWGFQAEGAAPIVRGSPVEHPETLATAIRIGNPASWEAAVAARDESGGLIEAVSDDEIFSARSLIAHQEGLFCEPAAAASVAGLRRYAERLPPGPVVCTLTGHGLKDPDSAVTPWALPEPVEATREALLEALGW